MEPTGCPETSIRNYRYLLRNSPEERSSHTGTKFTLQSFEVRAIKKVTGKQFRRGSGCDFITHSPILFFNYINKL
jgi:CRISPR/Cas system endoribonuclease Cas6 (RAMP superfamily)